MCQDLLTETNTAQNRLKSYKKINLFRFSEFKRYLLKISLEIGEGRKYPTQRASSCKSG
jgi:hypothetical protein